MEHIDKLCADLRRTLQPTPQQLRRRCVEAFWSLRGAYPVDHTEAIVWAYKRDMINTDDLQRLDREYNLGLFTVEFGLEDR